MTVTHMYYTQLDLEEEEMELEDSLVHLPLSASTALRVNNNMLTSWEGFWSTLGDLYIDPAATLHWLDVSFNDLRSIDQVKFSHSLALLS